jgi:hypothetical protein
MTRNPIRYLPANLADSLRFELPDRVRAAVGSDGIWKIERLLESAFAAGYEQGWSRAYQGGRIDAQEAKPGAFEAHLLAVLRAVAEHYPAVEVTPEQLGTAGRVQVNNLTSGNTEFVAVNPKPLAGRGVRVDDIDPADIQ